MLSACAWGNTQSLLPLRAFALRCGKSPTAASDNFAEPEAPTTALSRVALDGKTLRASLDRFEDWQAVQMHSALAIKAIFESLISIAFPRQRRQAPESKDYSTFLCTVGQTSHTNDR